MIEGFHPQLTDELDMLHEQVRDAVAKALYAAGTVERGATVTARYRIAWKDGALTLGQAVSSRAPINDDQDRVTAGRMEQIGLWRPDIAGQTKLEDML